MRPRIAMLGLWLGLASPARADEPRTTEVIEVTGRSSPMTGGVAENATEGVVGAEQLALRPLLRPGEVLETVPGMIVTQHSGAGKANQFFLRGFNLDHGTDFATFVDGMPVNLPTHAHGQGYTDLNFLIPELVRGIRYRKGPYYADEGDFSSAGAAHVALVDGFAQNVFAQGTVGSFHHYRSLLGGSADLAGGSLLGAFEYLHDDGPWDDDQNLQKWNGLLRYSHGDAANGFDLTAMGYTSHWNATDQIPERAVASGLISRLGAIDPTDGGESQRVSVSGSWRRGDEDDATHVNAYFIDYELDLFSNFTFFLDDPVNGDQFEQEDDRQVYGLHAHQHWYRELGGFEMELVAGMQVRYDDVGTVGLFSTAARERLGTTRDDEVGQVSASPYLEHRATWLPWLRSVAGLRGDFYHFDVDSDEPLNSGEENDGLASPKLNLIFGPWWDTELYLSGGSGFHSNDARGTTIAVDPVTGDPASPVDPLVRTVGGEAGLRSAFLPDLQTTVSFFLLDIDSELLFIGDAGATEATRPSRRIGVEWTNFYTPFPWLTFDADFAFTRARFTDHDTSTPGDTGGNHIPGSIETAVAAGATVHDLSGFSGGLRLRYFGPRPLVEDDSVRSDPTTLVSLNLGYEFWDGWRAVFEIFNLLGAKDHDIDYFYASRLPGEPAEGVDDLHFHPVEPRAFRFTLRAAY
jgi:hypothetical protein